MLFYWSKMYSKGIKKRQDYEKLEKSIVILIADYELESLKEIKKYITKWNIREEKSPKIILTEVMELYIIELPKFEKYDNIEENEDLNSWIKFIKNLEVVKMDKVPKEIIKAKKVLEEISQDEHEIYLAELREKYIMDQKAVEGAGYDKGLKAGIKQGIEQGIKKGLEYNIPINIDTIKEGYPILCA